VTEDGLRRFELHLSSKATLKGQGSAALVRRAAHQALLRTWQLDVVGAAHLRKTRRSPKKTLPAQLARARRRRCSTTGAAGCA
jgi:hypothetical protein